MTKRIPNRPAKARSHVVTGLIAKRREIAGQIEDLQRRLGASLNNWKRVKKVLKSSPGPGDMLLWEIDRERIEATRGTWR